MMRLKELIKLAEVYGENAEVYIEIDELAKKHYAESKDAEIEELNGCTLTSVRNFKTMNGEEGIILKLPIYHKYQY